MSTATAIGLIIQSVSATIAFLSLVVALVLAIVRK
ncbi:hypothetical protein C7445_1394 [Alicyclobacillus sacchari]|uniref:Holin-like toxin n=1 Tax=Alicyclobacillus sacchari TaxID=392010 RepID=A0A4R8L6B2_9BACL|nr:hypothetical protein C7445_1394 [Alicyclobacillus sacchari]